MAGSTKNQKKKKRFRKITLKKRQGNMYNYRFSSSKEWVSLLFRSFSFATVPIFGNHEYTFHDS